VSSCDQCIYTGSDSRTARTRQYGSSAIGWRNLMSLRCSKLHQTVHQTLEVWDTL